MTSDQSLEQAEIEAMVEAMIAAGDYAPGQYAAAEMERIRAIIQKFAAAAHSAASRVRGERGFVVVPKEPTEQMCEAACDHGFGYLDAGDCWKYMTAASQQAAAREALTREAQQQGFYNTGEGNG